MIAEVWGEAHRSNVVLDLVKMSEEDQSEIVPVSLHNCNGIITVGAREALIKSLPARSRSADALVEQGAVVMDVDEWMDDGEWELADTFDGVYGQADDFPFMAD